MRAGSIGGVILIIWLVLGAVAANQRGYFKDDGDASCAQAGTVIVTGVAGPLDWMGINPKVKCDIPEPSK